MTDLAPKDQSGDGFRIFVLGAGFSCAAGLPLGNELWEIIQQRAGDRLDGEIERYLRYRLECDGMELDRENVDFEDFLSFLDLDHHLGLRGSDNWAPDGIYSQALVKNLIGSVLTERTPAGDALPQIYYDFASQLAPGDRVLTFNYDVLLERALDHVGVSYRLFPHRYEEVRSTHAVCSAEGKHEIVLLKLHGSLDWFDRIGYAEREQSFAEMGLESLPNDPIFGPSASVHLRSLVEGPRPSDDRLTSVYRTTAGLEDLYESDTLGYAVIPFLLTPSRAKAIYADYFRDFWWDLGKSSAFKLGVTVIGYSLPEHDDYAKQALWGMMRSYQDALWDEELLPGRRKGSVLLVDFATEPEQRTSFRRRYAFVDDAKSEFLFDGFGETAMERIASS